MPTTIAHASDLTGDDTAAFVHAAALAAATGARLVTLHAGAEGQPPDASELAHRWDRRIDHEVRWIPRDDDLADGLVQALRELKPALVVVGTHARHGLAALLRESVGEAIARNAGTMVLVVPNHARGFVDERDGVIDLTRVSIAAGTAREASRGLESARRLAALLEQPSLALELVHVGAPDPALDALGVPIDRRDGSIEHALVEAVRARRASLLVMPSHGHDGVGDVLLGSHTERVIRDAGCPVLTGPL